LELWIFFGILSNQAFRQEFIGKKRVLEIKKWTFWDRLLGGVCASRRERAGASGSKIA
jgi:hypothetical protein